MKRFALTIAIASTFPLEAAASEIPAFARKYRVTCAMCHSPIPRLNAVGEAFAANGFEFPGETPRDTIATGDPLLRLQNSLPLAMRYDAYLTAYAKRTGQQVIADAQTPWVIKLLSGGQVGNRISYYTYFLLTERGEVEGLEDAYIQFTNVRGSGVNVVIGQFQVSDPLFKRELRLQYDDYQPYRMRVGISPADLTYDRGLMALWSPRNGTDVALELVSGVGLTAANADRQYDMDGYKNVVLRLSQDIGSFRVGAFGYYGREGAGGGGGGGRNTVRVLGPDATLPLGAKVELNLQAFRRWDDDPFLGTCAPATPCPTGDTAPFATVVDAAFAEAVFSPTGPAGRWYFTALVNYIDAAKPVVSLRLGEPGLLQRYVTSGLGAHYLLRRNVRMMTEAHWDHERAQGRFVGGFTLAY